MNYSSDYISDEAYIIYVNAGIQEDTEGVDSMCKEMDRIFKWGLSEDKIADVVEVKSEIVKGWLA